MSHPVSWIVENSGKEAAPIVERVSQAEVGVGYDARTGEMVDMIAAGVADPVKVTCNALVNAASVAKLVLTTQTLITDIPEDEDPTAEPARGGGAERLALD